VRPQLTIVLVHGYALNLDSWHYQRRDLLDLGRVVLYDQRGHGRSGRGAKDNANIDQLGDDLRAVLDACAPAGPIVLVGHSMGGMTVMAFAERYAQLLRDRVIGVALMSTSPGRLAELTFGVPAAVARTAHRVVPRTLSLVNRQADLIERSRKAGSDLSYVLTKRYAFDSDVPPSLVQFVSAMIAATPFEVLAELFPAFDAHDKLEALPVLDGREVLVISGDGDLMIPVSHSEDLVGHLPGAELVILQDAGHLLMLEHHQVVNDHLRALVARAPRARPDDGGEIVPAGNAHAASVERSARETRARRWSLTTWWCSSISR
jgi:pimeloyl-ACP methyl ester carboxylesterase